MGSGARLRSANQAFGQSLTETAFLLSAEPPAPPVNVRLEAFWEYVNAGTNLVPTDLCQDRNPPDPTPGPDRPDLGNWTYTSRLQFVTQCMLPSWTPSWQIRFFINEGLPNEEILNFDITQNGVPWEDFADYDPAFSYYRLGLVCNVVLPGSPVLPRAAAFGGLQAPYTPVIPQRPGGFLHQFEIYHWDDVQLPTDFDEPFGIEIPIQAAREVTSIINVGNDVIATAPGHGLECGSAVRVFDAQGDERIGRIHELTTDTFTWDHRFYGGPWSGEPTGFWQPAYDAAIESHSRC